MSGFEAFFAQNKVKTEDVKFAVSNKFVGADGKPLEWTLRPIDELVNDRLKAESTRKFTGANRMTRQEIDGTTYICKLIVATVVYPDLNNKELQDSYGVMGAEKLIRKMLLSGEYNKLMNKVQAVNGFDIDTEELVDEAKN